MVFRPNIPINEQPAAVMDQAITTLWGNKNYCHLDTIIKNAIPSLRDAYIAIALAEDKANGGTLTREDILRKKMSKQEILGHLDKVIALNNDGIKGKNNSEEESHNPFLLVFRVTIAALPDGEYTVADIEKALIPELKKVAGDDKKITLQKLQNFYRQDVKPLYAAKAEVVPLTSQTVDTVVTDESQTTASPDGDRQQVASPASPAEPSKEEEPQRITTDVAAPDVKEASEAAQPSVSYTTKQLQLYQLAKLLGKEEFTKSYGVESMSLIDNLPLPPAFGASENQNQGRS